jgi:cytochrome c-type biogenesis protein
MGPFVFSFLAGGLVTLSPCVLPLLPLIMGGAVSKNRFAPFQIAFGLVVSFTLIGAITSLFAQWVDGEIVRLLSASLMIVGGLIVVIPCARSLLEQQMLPIVQKASNASIRLQSDHFLSNLGLGALLGAIWSPCVGPILGIAIGYAATTENFIRGTSLIFAFSLGSAVPLILATYFSRGLFQKIGRLSAPWTKRLTTALGFVIIFVGLATLSGLDKKLERAALKVIPERWVEVITRY